MRIIMVALVLVSVIRCAANSLEVFARVLARDLRSRSSLEIFTRVNARDLRSRSSLEVFARGLRSRSSLEVFARGLRADESSESRTFYSTVIDGTFQLRVAHGPWLVDLFYLPHPLENPHRLMIFTTSANNWHLESCMQSNVNIDCFYDLKEF